MKKIQNALWLIWVAVMIAFAVSCSAEKQLAKKEKQAKEFYQVNPELLAEFCDEEFPIPEVQYIPGDTIVKTVVKEMPGKEIECPEPTPENPKPTVKCPDVKTKTKYIYKTDTVKIVDSRQVFLVQEELKRANEINETQNLTINQQKDQIRELQNGRNNWRWMFIVLAVAVGLFLAFKIFK